MKKAILYTRVTSKKPKDPLYGNKGQEMQLRMFCRAYGFKIVKIYNDRFPNSLTAQNKIAEMYREVQTGKIEAEFFIYLTNKIFGNSLEAGIALQSNLYQLGLHQVPTDTYKPDMEFPLLEKKVRTTDKLENEK